MFKALGHPARLHIVQILSKRGACVCGEMVDELPLAQATVSQHLKVLKQAGLITGEIQGSAVCYCLAPGVLEALQHGVTALAAGVSEDGVSSPSVLHIQRKESANENAHTA